MRILEFINLKMLWNGAICEKFVFAFIWKYIENLDELSWSWEFWWLRELRRKETKKCNNNLLKLEEENNGWMVGMVPNPAWRKN